MRQDVRGIKLISDGELAKTLQRMAGDLRSVEAEMLLYLSEMQERKLFAQAGYASLFAYCVGELKFSEATTCRRLAAARVAAKFPEVMARVISGELHVTGLAMLEKHLNKDNVADLIGRAVGCSKTQLEWLIAEMAPKEDVRDSIRKAPVGIINTSKAGTDQAMSFSRDDVGARHADKPKAVIQPTAPQRVLIKCSASEQVAVKIKRAQELLAHKYPGGELEHILEAALDALLEKVAPECKEARQAKRREKKLLKEAGAAGTSCAAGETGIPVIESMNAEGAAHAVIPAKPSPSPKTPARNTRYVPAAVKAEALRESGGQCTYVSPEGRRCEERRALQFDHAEPFALGGHSTSENIRVYCRCHNAYAARQTFGSHEPWRVKAV